MNEITRQLLRLLMGASSFSQQNLAQMVQLIADGAEVSAQDSIGETPLHYAVEQGHTSAIRMLLEAGATIETEQEWGTTPIHIAAMKSSTNLQVLFVYGVPVDTKDANGHTPLWSAFQGRENSTMAMLLSEGASIWALTMKDIQYGDILRFHLDEWCAKLNSGHIPKSREEVMQIISVMPVATDKAIPEPLARAKQLLDGMPHTAEIATLYETGLGIQRPPAPPQSLQEMRKAAAPQKGVEL